LTAADIVAMTFWTTPLSDAGMSLTVKFWTPRTPPLMFSISCRTDDRRVLMPPRRDWGQPRSDARSDREELRMVRRSGGDEPTLEGA